MQAEIARLRRQLEVSESLLKRSEAALGVMGYAELQNMPMLT